MKRRLAAIGVVVSLGLSFSPRQLLAQAAPSPQSTQQSSSGSENGLTAISTYPDAPEGLEHLMDHMLKLQKSGDAKALALYVQSLILPNPSAWFTATFGEKLGAELADAYDRTRLNLPLSFPDTLGQIQSKHLSNVQATRFSDPCNQESTNTEYHLLVSRTHEQPLYHVRLSSGTQAAILGFFVYLDGAFRYVGDFQIATPAVVKIGGKVMSAKRLEGTNPHYPAYALQTRVSGTVVIHAIIGANGSVCSLQVLSGPLALVGASLDAVRKWRYSPETVNGSPVSVETTITVVFSLGN